MGEDEVLEVAVVVEEEEEEEPCARRPSTYPVPKPIVTPHQHLGLQHTHASSHRNNNMEELVVVVLEDTTHTTRDTISTHNNISYRDPHGHYITTKNPHPRPCTHPRRRRPLSVASRTCMPATSLHHKCTRPRHLPSTTSIHHLRLVRPYHRT